MKHSALIILILTVVIGISACTKDTPGNPSPVNATPTYTVCGYGHKTDLTTSGEWSGNYITLSPITPTANMYISSADVNMNNNGRLVVVIYSSNSGMPENLLSRSACVSVTNTGWVNMPFPGITLQANTAYWYGAVSDQMAIMTQDPTSEVCKYYLTSWTADDANIPAASVTWEPYAASNYIFLNGNCY